MRIGTQALTAAVIATFAAATPVAAQTFTVGPESFTYDGFARGYFFTAPTNFNLTSLFVEGAVSNGNQWAQVVRLNSAPTQFPTTTTDFTTLGYFTNQAASTSITTSIQIAAGDIVGILGTRGESSINSYGRGPYTSAIAGIPVTIQRLGYQGSLNNGTATELFTESGNASYSRISFTYDLGVAAVPEPATWAMMISGFGMVGGSLRRRRQVRTTKVSFA